jgi:tRNA-specific adenosine deaminase 1
MAAQEDATPWAIPPDASGAGPDAADADAAADSLLDGRAHFSRLGVVRRKPARTDAEATRSKSCSDKLALREVASLLSLETSLLVAPSASAYLAGLIMPEGEVSRDGCERAFGGSGRMGSLAGLAWPGGGEGIGGRYYYGFRPFRVLSIPTALFEELWAFGKPAPQERSSIAGVIPRKSKPGVVSAIWARAPSGPDTVPQENGTRILPSLRGSRTGLYENIINGVRQGNRASSPSSRGASGLSRAKLWCLLREVLLVNSGPVEKREPGTRSESVTHDEKKAGDTRGRALGASTYYDFKQASLGARSDAIHNARKTLKGWIRNTGDEDWGLDVLVDPKKRKREEPL